MVGISQVESNNKAFSFVLGSVVVLSCHSHLPWLFCVWVSPTSERHCAVRLDNGIVRSSICEGRRTNVTASRGNICQIKIQASSLDHGSWTCHLTLGKEGYYTSTSSYMEVQVAAKPRLSISKGEKGEIICKAAKAFPRPVFLWSMGDATMDPQKVFVLVFLFL